MKKSQIITIVIIVFIGIGIYKVVSKNNELDKANQKSIPVKIELQKIAGHSQKEVEAILGKGTFESSVKDSRANCKNDDCPKIKYGDVEIVYINQKADWINIDNLSEYDYSPNALQLLGLDETNYSPKFQNGTVTRYKGIENINELSIFENGKGKIDYIYVKVLTE